MASQRDIFLYAGDASPNDIVLRALPLVDIVSTTIWLLALDATPKNIILRDPTATPVVGGFPTQYLGFRIHKGSGDIDICLVAEADAPAGMGGVWKIRVGGVTRAVYLVETGDGNASPLYIRTVTGTKAARLKT